MKVTMLCTMKSKRYALTMHTDASAISCKCLDTDLFITSDVTLAKVLAQCVEVAHEEALVMNSQTEAGRSVVTPVRSVAKKVFSFALLAAVMAPAAAMASNADVNNFLKKMDAAYADIQRPDLYNEAVNAFDNLNARDRMVVAGIADKTQYNGMIKDVIGSAEARGHQANVPVGWKPELTRQFLRDAHPVAAAPAPTSRMAAAPAAYDPVVHANANANAALKQNFAQSAAIGQNQKDIAAAQFSADSAQNSVNLLNGKTDIIQKEVMTVDTRVDGVEDTANQNTKDIAANNARDDGQDAAIHHATVNGNAALKGLVVADQHIADNTKEIAETNDRVTGDELAQANRDRTANQHVAPVVGHDGADGKDGKDGADGKDGVTTTITKVETDTATQAEVQALKGAALTAANQARTASQHVAAPAAKDGVNGADGKDGAAGKDGVTTTVTKVQTDTATQKKVAAHDSTIRAVSAEQQAQGEFIQREAVAINQQAAVINHNAARIDDNSARIQQNSQRIDRNSKRIDETKEDLKRGLNNAAAMSSLHFDGNHNSWALSTGSANGEGAAMAGGLQKSVTDHAAVTVQFSNSFDGGYMVGAGVHGDW